MNMDKNDLVAFFQELRILYGNSLKNMEWVLKIEEYLGKDNVDVLDIKRMYRFLDKNVKKDDISEEGEEYLGENDESDFEDDCYE
jgi:hypothetical protein